MAATSVVFVNRTAPRLGSKIGRGILYIILIAAAIVQLLPLVWLLLFFGSGLAIMNFHEDVSMPEVHRRIESGATTGKLVLEVAP